MGPTDVRGVQKLFDVRRKLTHLSLLQRLYQGTCPDSPLMGLGHQCLNVQGHRCPQVARSEVSPSQRRTPHHKRTRLGDPTVAEALVSAVLKTGRPGTACTVAKKRRPERGVSPNRSVPKRDWIANDDERWKRPSRSKRYLPNLTELCL